MTKDEAIKIVVDTAIKRYQHARQDIKAAVAVLEPVKSAPVKKVTK